MSMEKGKNNPCSLRVDSRLFYYKEQAFGEPVLFLFVMFVLEQIFCYNIYKFGVRHSTLSMEAEMDFGSIYRLAVWR